MRGAVGGAPARTPFRLSGLFLAAGPLSARGWSFDPLVATALLAGAALYARGAWVSWFTKDVVRGLKAWQASAFAAGWVAACVALLSPLESLGAGRLSAREAQLVLLMFVAAPLLVLGRPLVPFLWAFPRETRKRLVARTRTRGVVRAWRAVTHPVVAVLAPALTLWLWHLPFSAPRSWPLHELELVMAFSSGVLFFRALGPGRAGRFGSGLAAVLVFATVLHTSLLGVLLTFSTRPWFDVTGAASLLEQRLAGMILWLLGGLVLSGVGLAHLAAWLDRGDLRPRATVERFTRSRPRTTRTQP